VLDTLAGASSAILVRDGESSQDEAVGWRVDDLGKLSYFALRQSRALTPARGF
jgi:hypothetical protein